MISWHCTNEKKEKKRVFQEWCRFDEASWPRKESNQKWTRSLKHQVIYLWIHLAVATISFETRPKQMWSTDEWLCLVKMVYYARHAKLNVTLSTDALLLCSHHLTLWCHYLKKMNFKYGEGARQIDIWAH